MDFPHEADTSAAVPIVPDDERERLYNDYGWHYEDYLASWATMWGDSAVTLVSEKRVVFGREVAWSCAKLTEDQFWACLGQYDRLIGEMEVLDSKHSDSQEESVEAIVARNSLMGRLQLEWMPYRIALLL